MWLHLAFLSNREVNSNLGSGTDRAVGDRAGARTGTGKVTHTTLPLSVIVSVMNKFRDGITPFSVISVWTRESFIFVYLFHVVFWGLLVGQAKDW